MEFVLPSRSSIVRLTVLALSIAAVLTLLRWPIELEGRAVHARVEIDRPRAEVYEFVTTPKNWPAWRASSIAVRGQTGYSLGVGQGVAEEFLMAGRFGLAHWTVTVRDQPFLWIIDAQVEGSQAGGQVRYLLTSVGGGTRFEREFVYRMPNLGSYLFASAVLHHQFVDEAQQALERLKEVLEQRPNLTTAHSAAAQP